MEFIELTPEKYREWDDFCEVSDDAWFWHTTKWLDYSLKFRPSLNAQSKSFMVFNNQELVAICPLILQTNEQGIKEFCYNNEHGPMSALNNNLSKKAKERIRKVIYDRLDELAKENNVSRTMFRFTVLSNSFTGNPSPKFNYLMKFGYSDNSINTQVLNLEKPIDDIRADMRYDCRTHINKDSKILSVEIFGNNNISREIFDEYINLHHKAAGRITRPRSTFDLMFDLVKKGNAFLIGAKKEKTFIGFSYFFVFKNNVYYGSACNDPEANHVSVSHVIQWAAIQYMVKKKYKFYELGWQQFGLQLYDMPSLKQINISEFKRGFGGFAVSWFRGEKFYDKDYFLEVQRERIEKYSQQL